MFLRDFVCLVRSFPPLAGYGSFGEFGDADGVMCLRGFVCLVAICHLDLVWERETWTARLGPPVFFYTPKEIGGLDMLSIGRAVLIPQFDLGRRRHRNNSCALQPSPCVRHGGKHGAHIGKKEKTSPVATLWETPLCSSLPGLLQYTRATT